MINCSEAAQLFNGYLDKELTNDEVSLIEEHLEKCGNCHGHMEYDMAVKKLLKHRAFAERMSENLKADIEKKLNEL